MTELNFRLLSIHSQILNSIYANEVENFKEIIKQGYDLNFKSEYSFTEFDQCITPLSAACYLGRIDIVNLMLMCDFTDINLPTEDHRQYLS